jgi:hypothetical protein
MRPFTLIAAALMTATSTSIAATGPDQTPDLQRVVLSTGGVAYFELAARVEGDARLTLPVRLDQVDDVLKSLVVLDPAGAPAGVEVAGREPLAQRFRDLPFPAEALESPVALLLALRGAEVMTRGARELSGRILSVTQDRVRLPDGQGTVTRYRLTLASEQGLRHVLLEDLESLRFTDRELGAQVREALALIAAYRAKDTRSVHIHTHGQGAREVRLGYLAAAPLWKVTYRLALDPEGENALVQAWGLLENMTGRDWQGVQLSLSSGNPVTFRQSLYQSYYVERPEVPVEVLGRVLPPPDTGAVARPEPQAAPMPPMAAERALKRGRAAMLSAPAESFDEIMAGAAAEEAPPVAAASAEEVAEQVLFTVERPVDVAAGHSLMVPIVHRRLPARRLVLYQPETHPRHPLGAVRLTNESETALPPGVVTVYTAQEAGAYLGDARLDGIPAGDSRLLTFAVDRNLSVDRDSHSQREVTRGRIVAGVLHLTRLERRLTDYRLRTTQDRTLWLEHPRRSGWRLVSHRDARLEEETADRYRLGLDLEAGESQTLQVVEERQVEETQHLSNLRPQQIQLYANDKTLPDDLRAAFARVAELQARVEELEQAIRRAEAEVESVHEDQERIRRNMESLDRNSDLYRRYVDKLTAQEDRLEQTDRRLKSLRDAHTTARKALAKYVRDLTL